MLDWGDSEHSGQMDGRMMLKWATEGKRARLEELGAEGDERGNGNFWTGGEGEENMDDGERTGRKSWIGRDADEMARVGSLGDYGG